ncbi:MAG: serine/threonine protein kinase [Myxococcales bacterium]|nr:serine/threonine protein kinase [Myxococcales bacterium]
MEDDSNEAAASTLVASDATQPASSPAIGVTDLKIVDADRYTSRKELARGGMGKIVTAFDRRLQRTVAIKEMRGQSADFIARFEREILLTARLEHPSIVTIHEAGQWPSGELFYAMRLVPGRSLDEKIAKCSTLEQRLALVPHVIAVADALAYAHQQRVIHRDLKPQNVMVGEFGETVVIDWGLAKQLDSSRASTASISQTAVSAQTELGAVLGTPMYMPPEQAAGLVTDERADVYAIGAILYHVLAGKPPYEGASTDVVAAVKRGPPPDVEQLQPGIAPDLLAIVRRAMAPRPQDRYPSARELADDLRAFHAGRLVGAYRYSTRDLVKRWLRRHRAPVGVAVIAMAALLGVAGVSVYRIVSARGVAEVQRELAEHNRGQAEDLLDFILWDLRGRLLSAGHADMFSDAMQKVSAYYAGRPIGTGSLERERRAGIHDGFGDALLARGDAAGAVREFRAALGLVENLALTDDRARNVVIETHVNLGRGLAQQGDHAGALLQFRTALPICELAVRESATPRHVHILQDVHERIGDMLRQSDDLSGALVEYRIDLQLAEQMAMAAPNDKLEQRDLAVAHERIGLLLVQQGQTEDALGQYRSMVAILSALAKDSPENPQYQHDLALAHTHLGGLLQSQPDHVGALAEFRSALALDETLLAGDPKNGVYLSDLAADEIGIGDELDHLHETPRAIAAFRRSVVLEDQCVATDPTNADSAQQLSKALVKLGDALSDREPTSALEAYRRAVAIREPFAAKSPRDVRVQHQLAHAYHMLGEQLRAMGDTKGARPPLEAAIAIWDKLNAIDSSNPKWKDAADETRDTLAKLH